MKTLRFLPFLLVASVLGAQNIRQLPRANATTGANDSALVVVSDSAGTSVSPRTRAVSLHQLFLRPFGTTAKPSIAWALDSTTGISGAGGNIRFSVSGANHFDIQSDLFRAVRSTGVIAGGQGTASAPSLRTTADANTGVYVVGADTLGIAANGRQALMVVDSALLVHGAGTASCASSRGIIYTQSGNSDYKWTRAANSFSLCQAASELFRWNGSSLYASAGSAAAPTYSFGLTGTVGSDAGLWAKTGDTVGVSTDGVATLRIAGGNSTSLVGGAGNMTVLAGTGASRTMTLQTTNSGGTALNAVALDNSGRMTVEGTVKTNAAGAANAVAYRIGADGTGFWTSDFNNIIASNNGVQSLTVSGGAATTLTGGAGSMTILAGTGASRTMTLQTTNSGSTTQTNLTLAADQSSTFSSHVVVGGSGQLRVPNSSAASPGLTFVNSTGSGLYVVTASTPDTLGMASQGAAFAFGLSDTLIVANEAKAPNLTAASGTPNTLCLNATTKQLLENAATSCVVSSARFKRDIRPLTSAAASSIVAQLQPVTFTYRTGGRRAIGLIAEQADTVDARLTTRDSDGQLNSVNYEQVTIALLREVQTLRAKLGAMCAAGVKSAC